MTSMGVTTATASVTPAARPAGWTLVGVFSQVGGWAGERGMRGGERDEGGGEGEIPKKVACPLTAPVSLLARSCL